MTTGRINQVCESTPEQLQ